MNSRFQAGRGIYLPWRRSLFALASLSLAGLGLLLPQLRQPDGYLNPLVCPFLAGACALLVLGLAHGTHWQRMAGWLAVAVTGQAFALQLLDVGPSIRIQHYFTWGELLVWPRWLFLVGLIVQTVIVFWGLRARWRTLWQGARCLLTGRQMVLLVAVLGFAGATFSRSPIRYALELVLAAWVVTANGLNLALVADAAPKEGLRGWAERWCRKILGNNQETFATSAWGQRLPWLVAAWVTVVTALLAWYALDGIPHIPDGIAYLFQAKYFSQGLMYLPLPPDIESFPAPFMVSEGAKWFAATPPAWPAVLAVGVLAGVPWLVNPILGGLAILLTHALLRRLYDHTVAHLVVLFLALSPWFLYMSASYLNHALALVCALLGFLGVQRARESGRAAWAVLAGAALGGLSLNRPLEALLVGGVVGLWTLGIGGRRLPLRALAGFVIAGLIVGGLNLPYNRVLTGKADYLPIMQFTDETYYPGANRLGFGPDIGNFGWTGLDPFPGHGFPDVVVNANQNSYMLNFELLGWSCGSLLFVLLFLLWFRWKRTDWVFLGVLLAVGGGYSFYWFSGGPDFGARYWYQMLVPLVVLTVRGAQEAAQRLARATDEAGGQRLWVFALAASLVAFVTVVPWRALDKYYNYRGMRPDIRLLQRENSFGNSLVLVQGEVWPDYCSAVIFSPPTLESAGTIYAWDAGPAHTARLRAHYQDRPVWIVAGSSVTGAGLRVVAGPLAPGDGP